MISKQWRRAGTAGRVFVVKCGCGASGAACLEVDGAYEPPEPPPSRARENVEGLAWGAFFNDALHAGCSSCRPQARKWMRASLVSPVGDDAVSTTCPGRHGLVDFGALTH